MQPTGRCQYIFDATLGRWIPWEGTTAGFGGVTLFTLGGVALGTHLTGETYATNTTPGLDANASDYGVFGANNVPRVNLRDDIDAQAVGATVGQLAGNAARLQAFNGTTYDRTRSFAGNADAMVAPTLGLLGSASFNLGFNGTTYDRARTQGNSINGQAALTSGVQAVAAYPYGFNGTTWDRVSIGLTSSDAIVPATALQMVGMTYLFDGTNWERQRVQSSTNAALATQVGAALVAPPANWSIVHTPAANTQATISRAAVASTRHICTSLSAVLTAPAAIASGTVQINLRDGATGAGTILWSQTLQVGGATSISADRAIIQLSGLQIFGTANTAMTLEFSAAGGASTLESVSLTGYDVAG